MGSNNRQNYKENERQQRLDDSGLNDLPDYTQSSLAEEENSGGSPRPDKKVIFAVIIVACLLLLAFLLRSCQGGSSSPAPAEEEAAEEFDWEKAFQEAMAILEGEEEENYPTAITLFTETLDEKPDLVDAWKGLTIIYLRMGETALAEETLMRGYETTNDETLRSWAEELAQESSPAETEQPAEEEPQPVVQEETDEFDGHEPVTLTCTFIPYDENRDWQLSLLQQYSSSYLVNEDSHGFRFSEPVEAYNPLTGEKAMVTEAIAYFYKNGSYHAWEKDFNIEQGGTYTVTGFWCSPADLYGEGTWVDDKLFGPRGHNEAGDWYSLYTYGPYCFAVARVE